MKITVIGTGYVGLVVGACFSETGNQVTCADVQADKIADLLKGKLPIYEPGLGEIVEKNFKEGRLHFTTDVDAAIREAEVIFTAVGTPMGEDGSADLKYVLQVAERIGKNLNGYKVIVGKSTVPVGTADKVRAEISKHLPKDNQQIFDVVSNPEFLKEGAAVEDFLRPDRIVLGVESEKAKQVMELLYQPMVRNNNPILFMDVRSAEMTKYAANAMLATRISFINEIANLCDKAGADIDLVKKGIGTDSRIGSAFLHPGVGYGGSCFPKDVKALIKTASDFGAESRIIESVEEVNKSQKKVLTNKILEHYKNNINGKTFAMWGLAFKARTDDIRESPALEIAADLVKAGAKVRAADPEAIPNTKKYLGDMNGQIEYFEDHLDALDGADALLIVTDWREYQTPDIDAMKKRLKAPVIFDGRNLYSKLRMKSRGFTYTCIGANRPD